MLAVLEMIFIFLIVVSQAVVVNSTGLSNQISTFGAYDNIDDNRDYQFCHDQALRQFSKCIENCKVWSRSYACSENFQDSLIKCPCTPGCPGLRVIYLLKKNIFSDGCPCESWDCSVTNRNDSVLTVYNDVLTNQYLISNKG